MVGKEEEGRIKKVTSVKKGARKSYFSLCYLTHRIRRERERERESTREGRRKEKREKKRKERKNDFHSLRSHFSLVASLFVKESSALHSPSTRALKRPCRPQDRCV